MTSAPVRPVRVLCLGNELLADDGLGYVVARRLGKLDLPCVDVVFKANTGFNLLEETLNVDRLIVVDTILSGTADPGTVWVFREEYVQSYSGGSPHYIGLFEALALARQLELAAPDDVVIIAVEAADCTTVGGPMTSAVEAAVHGVVDLIRQYAESADELGLRPLELPHTRSIDG